MEILADQIHASVITEEASLALAAFSPDYITLQHISTFLFLQLQTSQY
jgi:hypothetical protein